ncbi:MAG: asparagine synthase (glutamine-hydrolyzing) [Saprospiraceae bacterium]
MCGIVGTIAPIKNIAKQTEMLRHRGPDDFGRFEDEYIGLGHRRLSIQDLSPNGHQPMFTEDKRYCIVFNGEIYNHKEIRAKFKDKYSFKSTGDTETVLYGYLEYGTDLFNMLNGIFAFAIYDRQTGELIIVRDQFGIKPLYFYAKGGVFSFASEIKAIIQLPDIDKSIDYKALVNYINFLWSPGEKTPFAAVKKLLPGHFIKLNVKSPEKFTISKYYEIPFNGTYSTKSEEALIEELDQLLYQAVERQLLSDVPVGFFLSGGLDSSAVVAMARRIMPNKQLSCYTIDTGEGESSEGFTSDLHYAKLVAKHLDADLYIVKADIDIVRDFDKMIYHLDEPQADAAPLNVLNICKEARKNGDIVLLGGTAGDDLFSGYRRHQALSLEKYFNYVPLFATSLAKRFTSLLDVKRPLVRRVRKLLTDMDKPKLLRMAGYFNWLPLEKNKQLFSQAIQEKIADFNPSNYLINSLKNIPNEKNALNQMLFWEMKYFLCDHNLNYTDKLSMADGIEVRVPFLDKDLVEFSTKIPPHLKLKGKTTKYLLKKVMERYLPHEVIYRPKAGFGAPVREWVTEGLSPMIESYLSEKNVFDRDIFDFESLQKLIKENKEGKIDASYSIWCILAIESWFRQFSDISNA